MEFATIVLLAVGLALIVKGSDVFIDGAVAVAKQMGVSEHLIGLTLVAFATSAPELATSMIASAQGHGPLVMGNVVGSNMANICLVLGTVLLIRSIQPEREARRDGYVLVFSAVALLGLCIDGTFSLLDSMVFIVFYVLYFLHLYRSRSSVDVEETDLGMGVGVAFVIGGSLSLVWGSFLLVRGAVDIASQLGVSKLLIGLTIVAIGTSLPEMAASLVATLKGSRGIAVGNIIGSNIINTFLVLGVAGAIADIPVEARFVQYQLVIMLIVSIVLMTMVHRRMARWMGLVLLALYFPLFYFFA